jgi:twitching motility protein PilT
VTLEDPIEFLFENKKALVSQREIGLDVPDFQTALKYLMREDPDVVLIGELRDQETFSAALQAGETGHLVLGTIHSSGAPQTIGRLLDLFHAADREQARQALAFNLRAVVCQMLLPSAAQGVDRVPACEVMLASPLVRQYIAEGKENDLFDAIRAGEREGMRTFTTSLLELIERDFVDVRTAYEYAPNADELKMRVKGISTSPGGLITRSPGGA